MTDDDEALGTVTAPAHVRRAPTPRPVLDPHPTVVGSAACDVCGSLRTRAYAHPNPLRPGVVVYRCPRHRSVSSVRDDPKAAPGGGVYR
jgi:hypothetical protein